MAPKPKLIALNAGLALGLALVIWQGTESWHEAQARRKATVNIPVKKVTPPPMTPAKKPDAVQAAKYSDVASKNLFSKDRNPTVVVDQKVDPPKVMPPLPVVYGVLGLPSGVKAIMAERAGGQSKPVSAGDTVGEFKVISLDLRKVKFEWEGRQLDRNLDDLVDHSTAPATAAAAAPAAPGPAVAAAQPTAAPAAPTSSVLGAETTAPEGAARSCTKGDNSPVGTVVDGYKKTGLETPFGLMACRWIQSK